MIALDLDNTIIRYDRAFQVAAERLGCLPIAGPVNKSTVKAVALTVGGNDLWTRLQGLVYGEEISQAELFPGCAEFVEAAREELVIVSHKTRFPAIGEHTDLREAALAFLARTPLGGIPTHFLDTRAAKVAKIAELRPRALLDDLPEVFSTPGFPPETDFLLFDPENAQPSWSVTPRVLSWRQAADILFQK